MTTMLRQLWISHPLVYLTIAIVGLLVTMYLAKRFKTSAGMSLRAWLFLGLIFEDEAVYHPTGTAWSALEEQGLVHVVEGNAALTTQGRSTLLEHMRDGATIFERLYFRWTARRRKRRASHHPVILWYRPCAESDGNLIVGWPDRGGQQLTLSDDSVLQIAAMLEQHKHRRSLLVSVNLGGGVAQELMIAPKLMPYVRPVIASIAAEIKYRHANEKLDAARRTLAGD